MILKILRFASPFFRLCIRRKLIEAITYVKLSSPTLLAHHTKLSFVNIEMASDGLQISGEDIVRVMLQYLKENNLTKSFECLQNESEIALNTVESVEVFIGDIQQGKWDSVLSQISTMRLPREKIIPIYEQIIFELLENGERELAREFLRSTPCLSTSLKTDEPQRYLRLEHLCQKSIFNPMEVYEFQSSKELHRQTIADSLINEVSVVQPSRMLVLLGQALKYQQISGQLPTGAQGNSFDLFKGGRKAARKDVEEKVIKRLAGSIKFAAGSHAETACFSPDGASMVTGSIDGFVEVWDYESCKLRKDLEYQAKDELMTHEAEAVLCSAFSKDCEHLATGSQGGQVKLWKISTGVCLRKFPQAHPQGITSITFSRDGTQLLTTSFDNSVRIHGIKSGKTLKELLGHGSYVNTACFSKDGSSIISGSSDGTVKVWDSRTCDCIATVRPGVLHGSIVRETTVHTIQLVPHTPDHLFVVTKSANAYIMTQSGEVLKTFAGGKPTGQGGDFLCATLSPQGRWAYCLGEDGIMSIFDVAKGALEESVSLSDREIISLVHHPHRNLLVTLADDGILKIWKA